MPRNNPLEHAPIEKRLKWTVELMLKSYKRTDRKEWIIPEDGLHTIIDDFIVSKGQSYVKYIVELYGVFKAINLYQNTYGEIKFEDFSFNKTYGTMLYVILDNYISKYGLVVEEK